MTKHINLQKNYSENSSGYQLKLPLNIETIIPENDSVRLLSQFVEEMDLTDLYSTYERINSLSQEHSWKLFCTLTWTIGSQPTDTTTLIPFLKDAEKHLKFKYKNITADAGYESEENYLFLEANNQVAFIKPANYEISKTRKYKNDIGKIENMEYDEMSDFYTCKNNKRLTVSHLKHSKSKIGYVSEKTIYICEDCSECPYKSNCIKGNNCKTPL